MAKDLLDVEAVSLVLLQHATQERHALWADRLPDGEVKGNLAGEQLGLTVFSVEAGFEGQSRRDESKEDNSQRPDIRLEAGGLVEHDLGRHEGEGACLFYDELVLAQFASQAEVSDFHARIGC